MKDVLLPLGLLVVALGVFFFFWDRPALTIFSPAVRVPVADATESAPVEAKAPAVKQRASTGKAKSSPAAASIEPSAEQIAVTRNDPVASSLIEVEPVRPTPRPPLDLTQITSGMSRSRVIELLGQPALKTTTILDGGFMETYVYTNTTQGEFLRLQLKNGVVVTE